MAIAEDYSKEVLEHLSAIPTWEPGALIQPGEIGRIRDGVFYAEGSLTDLWPEAPMAVEPKGDRDERYFVSSEVTLVGAGVTGGVSNVPANVEAKIKFERKGACVLHATHLAIEGLTKLHAVLAYMDGHKDAFEDIAVVSHVEAADRFRVFCAESNDWELGISGDVSAVQGLKIADASVSIASFRGAGYQASGSGPLVLRLYVVRRPFLGGSRVEPLEAGRADAPTDEPMVREIKPAELLA